MYIPKHYNNSNKRDAIAFMQRFPFGTIISSIDEIPFATHLPFITYLKKDQLIITSHFAKANEHWKHITEKECLIIFQEPHAYISPKHYGKKENVPTWNYIAVHAYGKIQLLSEKQEVLEVITSMIENFEPNYMEQWNDLSDNYKTKMMNGIVAFEMTVVNLQSKEKLSQNKKLNERKSIINSFSKSADLNKNILAKYMENRL